jgi:hypothetical protein
VLKPLIILFLALPCCGATIDDLLSAICQVESNCNSGAIGDNSKAIGAYQLWRIYVDDVCRISGKKFTYADRLNKDKSREMVKIYLEHYGKGKGLEAMARIHNGGPKGDKKQSTVKYWQKIKVILEGVKND